MLLKHFSRLSSVTSYFYLVYILSFAFIASCGSDFHNAIACCMKKTSLFYFKPSVRYCGCVSLHAGVWEIANSLFVTLWNCIIPLHPLSLLLLSRYTSYSLSSFSSYRSLSGPLTWVLPFSELKPFLVHLCCFGNGMSQAAYSIQDVCASDFYCYITGFFFCSVLNSP